MRRLVLTRSVVLRFAALVFLFQICSALLVLVIVHQLTEREMASASRSVASELREDLNAVYRDSGAADLAERVKAHLAEGRNPNAVILLTGPGGHACAGNLAAWPPNIAPGTPWKETVLFRSSRDDPERMVVSAERLPGGLQLLTGEVIESDLRFGGVMEEAILSALVLALPLALLAAWISARLIQARIASVVQTARAVETGDLERRVPIDGAGDVFEELGLAINAMLDRIDRLMGEMRLITDSLAHDLRSPLTRLKASLEKGLAADDGMALGQAMEEADILLSMLTTSLIVSRAEAGIGREHFRPADIAEMLSDLQEMYGPLAEENEVEIAARTSEPLVLPIHRELLGQAIANLIDNAMKYGGPHIMLRAEAIEAGARIIVADDGPGIAPEQRAQALRRFGRLDASRHSAGAGLGLSLVSAVARLHDGSLTLEDNQPGLRAVLTIKGVIASHA